MNSAIAGREGRLTLAWYGALFFAFGAHQPYWPVWLADWGLTQAEVGGYLGRGRKVSGRKVGISGRKVRGE